MSKIELPIATTCAGLPTPTKLITASNSLLGELGKFIYRIASRQSIRMKAISLPRPDGAQTSVDGCLPQWKTRRSSLWQSGWLHLGMAILFMLICQLSVRVGNCSSSFEPKATRGRHSVAPSIMISISSGPLRSAIRFKTGYIFASLVTQ